MFKSQDDIGFIISIDLEIAYIVYKYLYDYICFGIVTV